MHLGIRTISFRPLAGITVFRTCGHAHLGDQRYLVSVPWRGLRSFGPGCPGIRISPYHMVSVPWRGLRSFGLVETGEWIWDPTEVSVPWRGLRSFGLVFPIVARGAASDFRPLAGITVFRTRVSPPGTLSCIFYFRPLAGITVFRTKPGENHGGKVWTNFRPLAGITVFRTSSGSRL